MFYKLLAKVLARPAVTDWLIQRAMRTPYTHIAKDGDVYMERYWLFNPYPVNSSGASKGGLRALLPSIRLHKIMRPDSDRHKHDHPWDARTFILRNWYDEIRQDELIWADRLIHRAAGTTAMLRFGEFHRITEISPGGVWTLFVTWRYRGTWGFLVNGKKVPWREYLGLQRHG